MAFKFWKKNQKPEAPEEKDKVTEGTSVGLGEGEKKKVPAKATPKAAAVTDNTRRAPQVLLRPMLTEKSTQAGVYFFQVPVRVNRSEVKKAIKAVYGVTPAKVNILNRSGKHKNFAYRPGVRSDWKRAIVMLKPGDTISVE